MNKNLAQADVTNEKFDDIPRYLYDSDCDTDVDSCFVTTQTPTQKQQNIAQKVKKMTAFQLSLTKIASPKRMPYLFCRSKYDVDANYAAKEINGIRHVFYESANVNSVQYKVWPHLMAKQSLICVADFEGLPQTLYSKPLCWLINVSLFTPCA